MTEPDPPDATRGPTGKWPVVAGSAALLVGAVALAIWVARPEDPPSVVVYEVSGSARTATVTYSTFTGSGVRREEVTSFPWRKEVTAEAADSGLLTVTVGPGGGDVACAVSVDGVERRSGTARGARTSARCDWGGLVEVRRAGRGPRRRRGPTCPRTRPSR